MSRNNRSGSDDFFNAAVNYRPVNPPMTPQTSNNSPPTPQYPQFQSTYTPHTPFYQPPQFDYQQFQQFQQAQQQLGFLQFRQPRTRISEPEMQPGIEPEAEPETEVEAEPEASKAVRRKKGKMKADDKTKKPNTKQPWTPMEAKLLAQCYIDVSEDNFVGNSQGGPVFWRRIMENYNAQMDIKRTRDQLSSKWRIMRADVAKFNDFYVGYDRNRRSGEDDRAVMEQSRLAYYNETGRSFNLYESWLVLKDKPKFLAAAPIDVMGRSLAKRKNVVTVEESDDEREFETANLADPQPNTSFLVPTRFHDQPGNLKLPRSRGHLMQLRLVLLPLPSFKQRSTNLEALELSLLKPKRPPTKKYVRKKKNVRCLRRFNFWNRETQLHVNGGFSKKLERKSLTNTNNSFNYPTMKTTMRSFFLM